MTTTTMDGRSIKIEVETLKGRPWRVTLRDGMAGHGIGETLEQAEETLQVALSEVKRLRSEAKQ